MARLVALIALIPFSFVLGQVAPAPSPAPPPPNGAQGSPEKMHHHLDGLGRGGPESSNGMPQTELWERLEPLMFLSPAQIKLELDKWPRYQEMSLGEQGKLLQRIQDIKDRRRQMALKKARELNLNLTPERFEAFEAAFDAKSFANRKLLREEMAPRLKQLNDAMDQELKAKFGPASTAAATAAPSSPPSPPSPPK